MSSTYPFPGDSPLARARRVARAYRELVDPEVRAALDAQCTGWGETWVAPRIVRYDLDDWLCAADAADIAAVSLDCLRQWRRRGRLSGRQTGARSWEYLARDVLRMAGEVRRAHPCRRPVRDDH